MQYKRKNKLVVYQAKNGAIELRSDIEKQTLWATQAQITEVFNIDRTVVTKHIGNILKSKEVDEKSNVQKMHIANSDKLVAFYSTASMGAVWRVLIKKKLKLILKRCVTDIFKRAARQR